MKSTTERTMHLRYWVMVLLGPASLFAQNEESVFNSSQRQHLAAGKVIFLEPEPDYLLAAAIQIQAPSELIWETMLDHESLPDFVQDVRSNELIDRGEDWKVIEQSLKVHPFLPTIKYVYRETYGPGYRITFVRQSGGIRSMKGWWKLVSSETGKDTVLMYSVFMDVGWYVPDSWMKRGINKRVPDLLKTFRQEVNRRLDEVGKSGKENP